MIRSISRCSLNLSTASSPSIASLYGIAMPLKRFPHKTSHPFIVFGDKDRLFSSRDGNYRILCFINLDSHVIDGGLELNVNRDEWMAERLAKQISQAPILALLGNLHTLKRVDRHPSMSKAFPYVAEILVSQGHRTKSYPQIWLDKACHTQNRLISSDEHETVRLINHNLISLLNASKYEAVNDVVDGVIFWECG